MALIIIKEATNIWKKIAKVPAEKHDDFELEIHKKVLEFFQVGDYYYYIFNVNTAQFEFVSPEITNVLGYKTSEIDIPFFFME